MTRPTSTTQPPRGIRFIAIHDDDPEGAADALLSLLQAPTPEVSGGRNDDADYEPCIDDDEAA